MTRNEITKQLRDELPRKAQLLYRTWCSGNIRGASQAIERIRKLCDETESFLKEDLWRNVNNG